LRVLSKLRKAFGNEKVKSLPHYRAIFIGVFLATGVATTSIEVYYLRMGQKTVTSFLLDSLLFAAIVGILLLVAYYLVGRVLSVYIEQHGKFEDLVNNSADTIYYLDNRGCIDWVNDAGLDAFGCGELKQVRGKPFADFIHPDDREMVSAYFDDGLKMRRATTSGLTFRMAKKDGDDLLVELQAHTVYDEEGNHVETVGIIRDVTTRKRYEEALERINAQLEGYAHTAAHDLKNPLQKVMLAAGGILGLGSYPEVEAARETTMSLAEDVMNAAEQANRIIEDLLFLAESGTAPKGVRLVSVADEVEEVLSEKAGDIMEKGVEVKLDDDLGQVIAAPTHIYQLFSNLISNAVKYNDNQKPIVEVRYRGGANGDGHRYLVHDNGTGIPPDIIDRVFMPFVRGKSGETGIGLSIVQKIVNAYGGSISAYNDHGACFEFTIKDFDGSRTI
jgi:PAS domain S-box-containing protein